MKNSSFIVLKLMLALVLLSDVSCTNLDEEVFDRITAENFLKSEAELTLMLGEAYASLHAFQGDTYSMMELSSDELVLPTRQQLWYDGGHWIRMHQHNYTPDDPLVASAWDFCYKGIDKCNRIIFQFKKLNTPDIDVLIAEAKALRALFYYWLLDLYGNVPLLDRFDVSAGFQPITKKRREVYEFVESELIENLEKLTRAVDKTTYGRINYYTAHVLLAKLYVNAGVYTGQPQWNKAKESIDLIIDSGLYSLNADYFDNFRTNNTQSPENIFVIPYDEELAQGFRLVMMTLHPESQKTFGLLTKPWNGYCTTKEFFDSFEDEDIRKNMFIVGPQYAANGAPIEDPRVETYDPDGPQLIYTPEINEIGPNALRQAGARIGKFEFIYGSSENLSNDFPIFRYSDIILMKAEIEYRLGNTALALENLNLIRSRAGLPERAEIDEEILLAERGHELAFEAVRRQDLIRFGKYNDSWWEKTASNPSKNIFPIPRNQLDANNKLIQNPGY